MSSMKLFILLTVLLFVSISALETYQHDGLTAESIVENHERRRDRLEDILQETIDKVAAHEAGREKFETDEEYETMKKRIGLYQKKLERMKKPLDDRDIEKIMDRERRRAERYRHYEL